MRFYDVTIGQEGGGQRVLRVASPTDVQAADAAVSMMKPREALLSIKEVADDGLQKADGPPPPTQAEASASVTPGMAARADRPSHRDR